MLQENYLLPPCLLSLPRRNFKGPPPASSHSLIEIFAPYIQREFSHPYPDTSLFSDDLTPPNTLRNEMLWQWFEAKCIIRSVSSTGKLPQSSQGCDWTRDSEWYGRHPGRRPCNKSLPRGEYLINLCHWSILRQCLQVEQTFILLVQSLSFLKIFYPCI